MSRVNVHTLLYPGNSTKVVAPMLLWFGQPNEEGTEIESGIDTCFSVQAAMSGGELQWATNGDESRVDHYSVYSSQDAQNLSKVAGVGVGIHAREMCSFTLAPGNYQLYVQAVGKPSMANRMPGPVSYSAACGG